MESPPSSKEIIPFSPRGFPPRKLNTRAFSADLSRARLALEEYNTTLEQIPFSSSFLVPFFSLEAIASLDSQKIPATLKDVLRAHHFRQKKDQHLDPILHYVHALSWSMKKCEHSGFSNAFICALHKKIKKGSAHQAEIGVFRKKQNWIGPYGCAIDEAYFYPPAPKDVSSMMSKLVRYANTKTKDPLLQIALIFAQLLIIHPFMDGNGRVARLMVPLFLYRQKAISAPQLFMSDYFKRHRLRYFETLYQTTEENRWEPWIQFFMKGVAVQARKSQRLLAKIAHLHRMLPRDLNSKMIHFLFQNPVFSLALFKKAGGTKRLLDMLIRLKWVRRDKEGYYLFSSLLKILPK